MIDDERPLAGIVASYLNKAGFDTALAYTGPDGVSSAQDLDPDVIILDLGLPGIDGIEVCRQIRLFSDCYILMLTARADEVDRRPLLQLPEVRLALVGEVSHALRELNGGHHG